MIDENEIARRFGERLKANAQAEAAMMQEAERALAPVATTMKIITATLTGSDQASVRERKLHRSEDGRYEVSYILDKRGRSPHTLRFLCGPDLRRTGTFIWIEGLPHETDVPAEEAEALASKVERFVTNYFAGPGSR
jgi:hypothetical protein